MLPLHNDLELDHTYDVVELESITLELIDWLNTSFGPPGPRWWISNYKVYFRDEKDYVWFEMRW
jgi:hypothetical protein